MSRRLVYVIGPSGAGKDSVLAWVMQHAEPGLGLHLARRSVSRAAHDSSEPHESLDSTQFAELARQGVFAMHWFANNLWYGVRHAELLPLAQGQTVLVNGSRGWLAEARLRFPDITVAQIIASPEVRRERLLLRRRESAEMIAARLERARTFELAPHEAHLSVMNDSTIEAAGASFLDQLARL